ncbi:hypothetical protein ACFW5X_25370 [Streptomyces albogriseolus]|uniref:hypothetical protein n=1 Tax=Streptomyces albogriseolus TaxID=1887 RepID=UPI0036C6351E
MAETTQTDPAGDTPTTEDARHQVLSAIILPSMTGLTEAQVRGTTCVWDGIALTPETAVSLGPVRMKRLDGHFEWFPRGCKRCVADKAYAALFLHSRECAECWRGPTCPFSIAANRLIREGR